MMMIMMIITMNPQFIPEDIDDDHHFNDDEDGIDNYDDNDGVRDNFPPTAGIERFFLMVYALAFGLVSSVYL